MSARRPATSPHARQALPAPPALASEFALLLKAAGSRGLRHPTIAVMRRLTRGETVSPRRYYFRTVADFEAPTDSRYAWLNRSIFVGVAERAPTSVTVNMYRIR